VRRRERKRRSRGRGREGGSALKVRRSEAKTGNTRIQEIPILGKVNKSFAFAHCLSHVDTAKKDRNSEIKNKIIIKYVLNPNTTNYRGIFKTIQNLYYLVKTLNMFII